MVVRDSGGQVVPHDEGVLNVTFVRVSAGAVSLPESYAALLDPIVSLAGEYGCDARCGRVANSVCEGKYDLSIGGRKFCGSAQRCVLRPCPTGATHVTVGHASIFCALDLDASVTAVSDFYRELTEPRAFHRDSHIDLRLAAGVTLDMHELALSLADQYRERWHAGRDVWCARPVLFS